MLAKAPDKKRAVAYLEASGAAAIWIKSVGGLASIHTGSKVPKIGDFSTWWITAAMAPRVASAARQGAGANPDVFLRPSPAWRDQRPAWARS
jgi:hypothetical protein